MEKKLTLTKMENCIVDEDQNSVYILKFINKPVEVSLEQIAWDAYVDLLSNIMLVDNYLISYGCRGNVVYDEHHKKFKIFTELSDIVYCKVEDGENLKKKWIKYDLKKNQACFVNCYEESDSFYLPVRTIATLDDRKVIEYIEKNSKRR